MASDDNFDFLSDVIGDDIVVGGVVYSSWEWTRDGEEGVRRLTTEEIEDREAADTASRGAIEPTGTPFTLDGDFCPF